MTEMLAALVPLVLEHRRCGEPEGGAVTACGWACEYGAESLQSF